MAQTPQPRRCRFIWLWAGVFLATLLAYAPALRGGFIWDDDGHVTKAGLRSLHGLWRIWFELGATQQYYPVLHSAFWVEHRLWGDAVLGYHLVNVFLHATSAFLFAVILRRLKVPGAWLAALIFALHPVCVESVAWISEQKNTLSTVFYLLSALTYLQWIEAGSGGLLDCEQSRGSTEATDGRAARPYLYLGASLFFILALLSKSVTATLPAALLVIIWWRHGRLSWKRDVVPLLPWFALGIAAGLFTAWVERTYIGAQGVPFELTLWGRGLLAGRVICFYLGKLLWPANLIFIYPRWRINAGEFHAYLFSIAVIALIAAFWLVRKRTRSPLAGLLFFVGSLFPALGFFNVFPFRFSYVADHFQYLASLGIIALVAGGLARSCRGEAQRRRVRLSAATLLLLVLGTLTFRQCEMYRNVETLYRTTIEKNPECWLAELNLGITLAGADRLPEAIGHYETALRLKPDYFEAHYDLGNALVQTGRPVEGMAQLEEALRIEPDSLKARLNLSAVLLQMGRMDEAIAAGEEAVRLQPNSLDAVYNLGVVYQSAGRAPAAIAWFEKALRLDPDDVAARNNLGITLAGAGRLPEAITQFQAALRTKPDDSQAHNNLGSALAAENRFPEAAAQYRAALRINPGDAEARKNLHELELLETAKGGP